jgi:DNA invertase Pin-like site-specific DNA recombinase
MVLLADCGPAGYEIISKYSDDGVKGADLVDQRPGFAGMLKHIASNGMKTIVVETANRFARDLITQETGCRFLRDAGIVLIAADSPDAFLDDIPTAVMIRQILGSVAQFERAMLVSKLRGARERRKRETGKCGDRMSYAELSPLTVAMAKRLHRYPANHRRRSPREIAAALEAAGHVTRKGTRYAPAAIARMVGETLRPGSLPAHTLLRLAAIPCPP